MYNKLFNKIVDSSIWMQEDHVRLVWMMFIAIMDEDGFVNLASERNVAHRAVMAMDKAVEAIRILESPDPESSNPANEGRRISRVPGGWIVLNAKEYRDIVKREHQKQLNRERVRKFRRGNATVMQCNDDVTLANETVTPSDTDTVADTTAETKKKKDIGVSKPDGVADQDWIDWLAVRKRKKHGPPTTAVMRRVEKQSKEAGITLAEAIAAAAENEWAGFQATWYRERVPEKVGRLPTPEERAVWRP